MKSKVGTVLIWFITLLIVVVPPLIGATVLDKVMTDKAEIEKTKVKLKSIANELARKQKEDK